MVGIAYAALWFFVFAVPWENIVVIPGLGAVTRLIGMAAVGLTMLAVIVSNRFRSWHAMHVAALLFVIWAGTTQLVFVSGRLSFKFLAYVQLLLVVWMIWQLASTRRQQLGLMLAYVLGAYVAIFRTFIAYRQTSGSLHRFAAEGFDPNDLGMIFSLAIPMAWYLGMTYRHPLMRLLCRVYVPIAVVGVGLTGSRGGMLACVTALLVVPFTMMKLSPSRLAGVMIVLSASGVVAATYIPEKTMERLASTTSEIQEGNLNGRLKLWVTGLHAFAQRPLTGHGSGSFKEVSRYWLGPHAQVAHNTYLSVLVEQGIVGFALFAVMLLAVVLAVLPLPRLERRFLLILLATLAITMLPLSWEDNKSVWSILAIVLGFSRTFVGAGGRDEGMLAPAAHPAASPSVAPASLASLRQAGRLGSIHRERA